MRSLDSDSLQTLREAEAALRRQLAFDEQLIESNDDCIKVLSLDARLFTMSENGRRALAIEDFERVRGANWLDFWHGDDRVAAESAVAAARSGGKGRFTGFMPTFADEPKWWDVAVTPITGADGLPERLLAVSRDVTEQRRVQEALRESEERYRAFSEALPGLTWTATPDGRLDFVGNRWSESRGAPHEDALGDGWLDVVHPDDRETARAAWNAAVVAGKQYDVQFRVRFASGEYRQQLVRALPMRDAADRITRWVGVNVDIEEQRRADAARRRIEEGLRMLAQTGAALSSSLDHGATLDNIAAAVAQEFATFCLIEIAEDDAERIAFAHRDPGQAYTPSVKERLAQPADGDSIITVPVVTPDLRVTGALTCAREGDRDGRRYDANDVTFAEELARRAGAAIANARLYQRERRIALTFQEAALPKSLPSLPLVRLDAEYRPGKTEAMIGGDWYDAFALDDGRLTFIVGDVLGNGLRAAAAMSKVRQAMQTAMMVHADPNAALDVADRTLRMHDAETYATASVAIYDHGRETLTIASAGHPGPAVRYADGRVVEYEVRGTMLGLRTPGEQRHTATLQVRAGDTLAFYTDGLIEATRDPDEGQRLLRAALMRPEVLDAAKPARAVVDAVLRGRPAEDDLALLTVRVG